MITRSPFLEENIEDGIINLSALARILQPEINGVMGRDVQVGVSHQGVMCLSPLALTSSASCLWEAKRAK